MSTNGIFALRKGNVIKKLDITHDAYPHGAGLDVAELIKTVDIAVFYDLIEDYDEASMDVELLDNEDFPDAPEEFSFERCKSAVRDKSVLYGKISTNHSLKGELFGDYIYVIDLDKKELSLYYCALIIDDIFIPEKNGRFDKFLYHRPVLFELEYIKAVNADRIPLLMEATIKEKVKKAEIETTRFTVADLNREDEAAPGFCEQKCKIHDILQKCINKLNQINGEIDELKILSETRAEKLVNGCELVEKSIDELEKTLDNMR